MKMLPSEGMPAAKQRIDLLRAFRGLVAVMVLCGCVAPVSAPPTPNLVWPQAPEPARIGYLRAFSGPDDLGIAKGIYQRLHDLFLGGDERRLVRPMAVAAVNGRLFVADPGAHGVHRFDPAAGEYELIRRAKGAVLPSPVGLASGPDGEIYIADSKLAQVLVIRPGDRVATPLVLGARLVQPTGIAFDSVAGRLLVVDTGEHRIKAFGLDGALRASFGQRGSADGQFNYPTMLWRAPNGHLYVTDSLNFRVQILAADGQFIAKFGQQGDGAGNLAQPKGVATDREGHVYVVDALFHAMQIFDEAGHLLLAVGAQGQEPGEFWLPAGIFIDGDNTIYIADSYNRRIQVLRYVGGRT